MSASGYPFEGGDSLPSSDNSQRFSASFERLPPNIRTGGLLFLRRCAPPRRLPRAALLVPLPLLHSIRGGGTSTLFDPTTALTAPGPRQDGRHPAVPVPAAAGDGGGSGVGLRAVDAQQQLAVLQADWWGHPVRVAEPPPAKRAVEVAVALRRRNVSGQDCFQEACPSCPGKSPKLRQLPRRPAAARITVRGS